MDIILKQVCIYQHLIILISQGVCLKIVREIILILLQF